MRICFDLDNTLCYGQPYEDARPVPGVADLLRELKGKGHTIIIYTARGMGSLAGDVGRVMSEFAPLVFDQLTDWGFQYDEIHFGKPAADLYVDDKAITAVSLTQIASAIERMTQSEVQEV